MTHQLTGQWRKSSYSANTDSCVEVAYGGDVVGIRDTKNRPAGQLTVPSSQWTHLLDAGKAGSLER